MSKTYHEPAREIPVSREAEVVVVGGGPAGLAAAIAAARTGARTVLIERFGYLGGTATVSLMACINGFRNQVAPEGLQTVRGIAEEIILALKAMDGLGISPYTQKDYPTLTGQLAYSYAIDTEKFKYVILKLCVEAGVDLLFHTTFSTPILSGNAVQGVVVENKSGRQALLAQVVIDASGDADVAARAGAPFWQNQAGKEPRLENGLMYRIEFGDDTQNLACDFKILAQDNGLVWGNKGFVHRMCFCL